MRMMMMIDCFYRLNGESLLCFGLNNVTFPHKDVSCLTENLIFGLLQ